MLMTIAQFAEWAGKSRGAVYQAIKQERLTFATDGKIDTDNQQSVSFANENRGNNGGKYSASKQTSAERAEKSEQPRRRSSSTVDRSEMERDDLEKERLREQIRKLELENKIKEGDFISRKLVEDKIFRPINDLLIRLVADLPRAALLNAKASIAAGLEDGPAEFQLKKLFEQNARRVKDQLLKGIEE